MAQITQAEKWRRHREAFTLALELGITPREAAAKIREIEERAAARAALARIHAAQVMLDARARARREAAHAAEAMPVEPDRDPQPWMMRD